MKLSSMIDIRGLRRFGKYALVGGTTFAFDLGLLFVTTDCFDWDPVVAATVSFAIAVSINYLWSRHFVFRGTLRSVGAGYAGFLLIAGGGMVFVAGGMWGATHILDWDPFFSRVAIAGITGIWNYLLNLFVNFRVAGKHGK